VLLAALFVVVLNVPSVRGSGTIHIRADGSIDPSGAPISTFDNVTYTLTGNITSDADGIIVERSHIIINGNGYTVECSGSGRGFNLTSITNVTIQNTNIKNFDYGIYLSYSSNNSISKNNITANNVAGICLAFSSDNSINGNASVNDGLFVLESSYRNVVVGNSVNGKPLVYLEGVSSYTVEDAGQVILVNCTNILVENLNVSNTSIGVELWETSKTAIAGNNVANNWWGIYVSYSSNNSISKNNITVSTVDGIHLHSSSHNGISGNNMIRNRHGILLMSSSNNIIAGNVFTGDGLVVLQSYGILAENNLVNGKPLVYLEGVSNHVVEDAGQVILVNCNNIRIENLNLSNTDYVIQLGGTNNTIITRNHITANSNYGILLFDSSNNNSIVGNNIANNGYGMWLETFSNNNSIIGNNITNNSHGIFLGGCSLNNRIFHNNFMNNTQQAVSLGDGTVSNWDDGYPSGGNYWSDYNGTDSLKGPYQNLTGSDGVGDVPYEIPIVNATGQTIGFIYANYSLMAPINIFDAGTWDGVAYDVDVVSNSTVSNFHFNPEEGAFINFNVTGEDGTSGLCRVTIPKSLLWVEDGWTILVGGDPITDYTIIPDENYTYIYFTYNHSTQTVIIQGTHVVPEFPSSLILPLFMATTLIAAIFCRRKQKTKLKTV
jgi:parallel beta-helix repeat protein